MHRDYSNLSSYVAVAVFDDRIDIRSIGALPRGVTAESLSGPHRSLPRSPLIAETFHRTGAVEIWGRGTNRVIEACERRGIELIEAGLLEMTIPDKPRSFRQKYRTTRTGTRLLAAHP